MQRWIADLMSEVFGRSGSAHAQPRSPTRGRRFASGSAHHDQRIAVKAGTDETIRVARDWIAKNASNLGTARPTVSEGAVVFQLT